MFIFRTIFISTNTNSFFSIMFQPSDESQEYSFNILIALTSGAVFIGVGYVRLVF